MTISQYRLDGWERTIMPSQHIPDRFAISQGWAAGRPLHTLVGVAESHGLPPCASQNHHWAHGVVVSHPLRMRKALGSNPNVSTCLKQTKSNQANCAHSAVSFLSGAFRKGMGSNPRAVIGIGCLCGCVGRLTPECHWRL